MKCIIINLIIIITIQFTFLFTGNHIIVHRATVLLRVSTVVAFCAALIGGGAVGAKAEITASVPAGVHWYALVGT